MPIPLSSNSDEGIDYPEALAELGLTWALLREVLTAGLIKRQQVTSLHAVGAGGSLQYHEHVPALTRLLRLQGWTFTDVQNMRIITSPDESVSLSVGSGDASTGLAAETPRKISNGPRTRQIAVRNGLIQAELDLGDSAERVLVRTAAKGIHWFFLTNLDDYAGVQRSELSKAVGQDHSGNLNFSQRIILPEIDINDDFPLTMGMESTSDDTDDEIDFEIWERDA